MVCVLAAVPSAAQTDDDASAPGTPRTGVALLDPSRFGGLTEGLAARVGLDRRLAETVGGRDLGDACISVETPGGELLYAHKDDAGLIPASTTKLFTGVAALSALGSNTRIRTEVWERDGVLYLRGGGDPLLATPQWIAEHPERAATPLAELADQARRSRPGAIAVRADASELDGTADVQGWEQRYFRDSTAPRVSALAVDRSHATPGPEWPKVSRGKGDADLEAASAFAAMYGAAGAEITRGQVPADADMVASVESVPVSEIVAEMNTFSDNFVAEVLLRHVGKRRNGTGSTEAGVDAEMAVLADLGTDLTGVTLRDGSGLHRESRVTCVAFMSLLSVAAADPAIAEPFAASLARGGADGTLEKRDLDQTVRAKTGTLNDVSNLVGIAGTGAGDLYFAVILNGDVTQSGRAHQIQDRVVEDIGAWPAP